jgi:SAM-dependent methyltransferase
MTDNSNMTTRQTPIRNLFRALLRVLAFASVAFVIISVLNFPYDYDRPLPRQEIEAARKYYEDAYRRQPLKTQAESEYQTRYEIVAKISAEQIGVERRVRAFVADYNLKDKAVLDIGSGRGHLQDIVNNYTGLDISASVGPFYHKKFVVGSATAMPFADNSFDAAWSIFVFEHIPNPEQAFAETRRVIRDRGLLFLMPAWNCGSWLTEGYEVRPYSDFGITGKLIKASVPLRSSPLYSAITLLPVRVFRQAAAAFGPTTLRYRRLTPNYETYWEQDSDAVNSIDIYEGLLWFISRGDECLNCDGSASFMHDRRSLIIRVNKSEQG